MMRSVNARPARRRDLGLWLAAAAVGVSLLALAALLWVLLAQSWAAFAPQPVALLQWREGGVEQRQLASVLSEDAQALVVRASEWQRRGEAYRRVPRSSLVDISYPADALTLRLHDGREILLQGEAAAWRDLAPAQALAVPGAPGPLSLHGAELADVAAVNALGRGERLWRGLQRAVEFTGASPAQGGGLFPALLGTVVLVLLMSVLVMPLGVLVAVWLHEYAGHEPVARLLRAAIANLAGVPSVIYGLFGLVLFVHGIGGHMDLLLADTAAAPHWGRGGLLWAALTLALLTLPVVVISVEEGLARVPAGLRQAALALGATRAEMLWRVVLPVARPALLTALILAVARAAGEVAPLMLVGAVKYAPALPVNGEFPYLHLSQQFMHLGHSVYDLALTGSDGPRDLAQAHAAALLLLLVVVALNASAIVVRDRLRERSRELSA